MREYVDCSCIKGLYEFDVRDKGCKLMLYQDLSEWQEEGRYVKPETYEVYVHPPHCSEPVKLTLSVENINKITPDNLGLSHRCLPDGIYGFSVKSCLKEYVKHVAWMCQLECRLECLVEKNADRDMVKDDWFEIQEIRLFVDSAKHAAEKDQPVLADKYYHMAKDLLDLLECDCKCC